MGAIIRDTWPQLDGGHRYEVIVGGKWTVMVDETADGKLTAVGRGEATAKHEQDALDQVRALHDEWAEEDRMFTWGFDEEVQ